MRSTSPSRRAAALLAVTTIGMSTAALSAVGVASAASPTGVTVAAGTCSIDFLLVGASGGGSEDFNGGAAGTVEFTMDVATGDEFTFLPGAEGGSPAGGTGGDGSTGGAGSAGAGGGGGGTALLLDGALIALAGGGGGAGTLAPGGYSGWYGESVDPDADSEAPDDVYFAGGTPGNEARAGAGGAVGPGATGVPGGNATGKTGGAGGGAGAGGGGGGWFGGGGGASDEVGGAGGGGGSSLIPSGATDGVFWSGGPGSVTYTLVPCAPGAPSAPAAPEISSADGGDASATVEFWPGDMDAGSAVTGYEYRLDGGTWTAFVTSTVDPDGDADDARTGRVNGLTNGTTYSVEVRAQSAAGPSAASAPVEVTPVREPAAVTGVTATPGVSSIAVAWTLPADRTGISGYQAFATPVGDQSSQRTVVCEPADPAGTSCLLGATAGLAYDVAVASLDSDGEFGARSEWVTTAVVAAPQAPASVPTASAPLTSSDTDGAVTAGQQVTVSGSGYLPDSTVELFVYSTPVSLGSVTVASDGTFSASVTVPADLADGTHHLVAAGVDENGNPRYLVTEVTVSGGVATVSGGLAYTGFTALPFVGAGVLALGLGGGLLVASRRRQA